jgi:hypothetical protein
MRQALFAGKRCRSDGFKRAVEGLGGYDARSAGEILYRQ